MHHDWPGNVRELRNVLEFSAYLSETGEITEEMLPTRVEGYEKIDENSEELPLSDRVKDFERAEINRMLSIYGHHLRGKKLVAQKLGISLASLYNKLK